MIKFTLSLVSAAGQSASRSASQSVSQSVGQPAQFAEVYLAVALSPSNGGTKLSWLVEFPPEEQASEARNIPDSFPSWDWEGPHTTIDTAATDAKEEDFEVFY